MKLTVARTTKKTGLEAGVRGRERPGAVSNSTGRIENTIGCRRPGIQFEDREVK